MTGTILQNTGERFSNGQAFRQERHSDTLAVREVQIKTQGAALVLTLVSAKFKTPISQLTSAKATHLLEECRGGLLPAL